MWPFLFSHWLEDNKIGVIPLDLRWEPFGEDGRAALPALDPLAITQERHKPLSCLSHCLFGYLLQQLTVCALTNTPNHHNLRNWFIPYEQVLP